MTLKIETRECGRYKTVNGRKAFVPDGPSIVRLSTDNGVLGEFFAPGDKDTFFYSGYSVTGYPTDEQRAEPDRAVFDYEVHMKKFNEPDIP